MAKAKLKSKTMLAALATVAIGVVEQAINFVPDQYNGIALAAAGVLFAVLRRYTTTAVK